MTSAPELIASLGLLINQASQALICCREGCQCAVSVDSSQLATHLRGKHKVPLKARRGLTRLLAALYLRNLDQLSPLEDGSPANPALAIHDGFDIATS